MSDPDLDAFLARTGLGDPARAVWTPLSGGVSSDIWKLDLPGRTLCVKRALAKLKVAADWRAPVGRNATEWAWMQHMRGVLPIAVPLPVAQDDDLGLFAMEYLEPASHPEWRRQLADGLVDPAVAAAVGERLAVLHAATARRPDLLAAFDTTETFTALRLDAYLAATGRAHPDLSGPIGALIDRTRTTRVALVHGDVSPKNILVGPKGPVFLDAETAWYGDPAFDLAFCLNHLLLEVIFRPDTLTPRLDSVSRMTSRYLAGATWEDASDLEARVAALLPALMLARVDGKSPLEGLALESHRDLIRRAAIPLIKAAPATVSAVASAWAMALPA